MRVTRFVGASLVSASIVLLAWLLYDASHIATTLQLTNIVDEATVAIGTLVVVALAAVVGVLLLKSARKSHALA